MYFETMEKVLPGQKIIISGSGDVEKVLPLEPYVTVNNAAAATQEAEKEAE